MPAETIPLRTVLSITGPDADSFLQGLVSNDISKLNNGLVYAAMLSPQGKYLADFFLLRQGDAILLDVAQGLSDGLLKRLNMYKLRADVAISPLDMPVSRGLGDVPDGAFADPRHPALGWRAYGLEATEGKTNWDAIRVEHCIPESLVELIPDDTYILEAGFEALNGVDFKKGCYVGQEVTARMKHKTELRKGFKTVHIDGEVPVGTEISSNGKTIGSVYTQANGKAIAYLRFDRIAPGMTAGTATLNA